MFHAFIIKFRSDREMFVENPCKALNKFKLKLSRCECVCFYWSAKCAAARCPVVVCFVSFFPPWICQSLVIHTILFTPPSYSFKIHIDIGACSTLFTTNSVSFSVFASNFLMYVSLVVCSGIGFASHTHQYHCIKNVVCVAIFFWGNARVLHIISCEQKRIQATYVFGRVCVTVCFPSPIPMHLVHVATRKPILAS